MNAKTLTIASAFVAFMMVAGPVSAQTPPPDASAPAAAAPAPDAAAPAAPADAGAPANTTTQSVENPYGLKALVTTGDFVSHGVLILLLIMSFGTWYIFVTKFVEQA